MGVAQVAVSPNVEAVDLTCDGARVEPIVRAHRDAGVGLAGHGGLRDAVKGRVADVARRDPRRIEYGGGPRRKRGGVRQEWGPGKVLDPVGDLVAVLRVRLEFLVGDQVDDVVAAAGAVAGRHLGAAADLDQLDSIRGESALVDAVGDEVQRRGDTRAQRHVGRPVCRVGADDPRTVVRRARLRRGADRLRGGLVAAFVNGLDDVGTLGAVGQVPVYVVGGLEQRGTVERCARCGGAGIDVVAVEVGLRVGVPDNRDLPIAGPGDDVCRRVGRCGVGARLDGGDVDVVDLGVGATVGVDGQLTVVHVGLDG